MERTTSFGTKYLPIEAYEMNTTATSHASGPVELFMKAGLTEEKANETAKNETLAETFTSLIEKIGDSITKAQGNLLYDMASKLTKKNSWKEHTDLLVSYIKEGKISKKVQLDEAYKFLGKKSVDLSKFDEAVGVGKEPTKDDIVKGVAEIIAKKKKEIEEKRYRFNQGILMGSVMKTDLKWGDLGLVKSELDSQIKALLGPRTDADDAPLPKEPKKKKESKKASSKAESDQSEDVTFKGASAKFHNVGENDKTEGYVTTENTKRLLAEHFKAVNGRVMTRFPPEPNGILHIGHAKAINFNFSYAKERDGLCYLRYDDTNPEKEEEQFFVGILRDVKWLGHTPWKITHSSDYFQELYECAVDLIKRGKAYVCHQDVSEIKGHESRQFSPWRERPMEESLKLFEDMKRGLIDEGKATLRMKHIMEDGKLDPVAYRIKFVPHHRTGDKWCIYPTYDFTHCLCDSFENITHSLCTKEFQNRRSSYYWLCNALDLYCPVQWEYGRLELSHTVVSKRKIGRLIEKGIVKDWDDPRLFTLSALRRRGFPPQAINNFCNKIGVTVSKSTVEPHLLDACVRDVLNVTATRVMAVLEPIRVVLEGFKDSREVTVANIPFDESAGSHTVSLCGTIYIDADDFQENPEKGFKRFSPTQTVGLKHAGLVLSFKDAVRNADGKVEEIRATFEELTTENKPKAFIHWVSSRSPSEEPARAEVRIYGQLFKSANPEEGGDFLKDVNSDTLSVCDAFIDEGVSKVEAGTVYQFERIGFFAVDPDTDESRMVFNRTVTLREDAGKSKKGK